MPADLKTPAQIEEQLAFTCAYEKDHIPERDPEADMLFEHANWRYKKNRLKEDMAVYPEVERLYRIATAWGHDKAANNLALMIMRGYTTHSDRISKPVNIAEDLISRGIPRGYYLMGFLLDKGYGVEQDSKASLQYFRKAADLGDPEAQFYVGDKLRRLTIDYPVPFKIGTDMKRCAADQGHAEAAIDTALDLKTDKKYDEALKYFQIATKVGKPSGPSRLYKTFDGPLPDDRMYFMGQAKDEERVARYKAIWKILNGYDYLPAKVDEIDEICPLPPAKLPPWDGKLKWVEKWESNEAPPLPSEERIAEMARAKNLDPETGLPVK
jgi:TPR repeat protein